MSRRVVGAYVCPRGVHCVEARIRRDGVSVVRAFEQYAPLRTPEDASRLLVRVLEDNDVARASVAIAIRGFELGHHTLSLPPARENMLAPIIDREVRRLEPQMTDPAVGWLPLPDDDFAATDQPPQRHFVVAAVPRAVVAAFETALGRAGHTLGHLTAVPAAFQRLITDLDPGRTTTAMLAPLPDGLFLGLFLNGGLRIAIEPPLLEHDVPDGAAMAEEAELGATYVRQQFRGAQVERAIILGPAELWTDTQAMLTERLAIPVERLDLDGLSSASLAALGAVLDSREATSLTLGGDSANRRVHQARATLRQTAAAAIVAAVLVGGWSVYQALEARRADGALRDARRRVESLSANVGPIRQTAEQRRLVRDALDLMRVGSRDRAHLQESLAALSGGIVGSVRLDSLALDRGSNGWISALAGTSSGATSGGAVQALHDFYRDLPRRVLVEELALEQMAYADTIAPDGRGARVAFQLTFVIPDRKD